MRTITEINDWGSFLVSEDPDGTIAEGLNIVLATQHGDSWKTELEPDGDGLRTYGLGAVDRVLTRDDLPRELESDISIDIETRELWVVRADSTIKFPYGRRAIVDGEELRALVKQGAEMRARWQESFDK